MSPANIPLTDNEVREMGYEPMAWGWRPLTNELAKGLDEAAARVYEGPGLPFVIPGTEPCVMCGDDAERSTARTPTCSAACLTALIERDGFPEVVQAPKRPPKAFRWPRRGSGKASVEAALGNIGNCAEVLGRYGVKVRARLAFCPFHDNERTPAMSLYERKGVARATCHSCGWSGSAIDLEAALSGRDNKAVIREWS